jgi:hypothetical protein
LDPSIEIEIELVIVFEIVVIVERNRSIRLITIAATLMNTIQSALFVGGFGRSVDCDSAPDPLSSIIDNDYDYEYEYDYD